MHLLYVAPRFHSNQIPIMKGWQQKGSDVLFVSQFSPEDEDHSVLEPIVLGYSLVFEVLVRLLRVLLWRKEKSEKKEYDLRTKAGFPPMGSASRIIKKFCPDVVIVRERALYNVPFVLCCKRAGIPCILYNQTALNMDDQAPIGKKFARPFFPQVRMTPVRSITAGCEKRCKTDFFVPFVQNVVIPYEQKVHFRSDRVNILCVARYEARKNLLMLVDAFAKMQGSEQSHLTIIGEKLNRDQFENYDQLRKKIGHLGLEERITLRENCSRDEVYREYANADLFVLPSTRERASVSQLEAMSCSLPVICSDTNGTACYVEQGQNGYLFRDNDVDDLKNKMEQLVLNRGLLLSYGRRSLELVQERYQFENYCNMIKRIVLILCQRKLKKRVSFDD